MSAPGIWGVSKGVSALPEVARAFEAAGIKVIADSRLDNIRRMREAGVALEYALIRIPMRSELEELVSLCDYTLISDIGTLEVLSEICERRGREVKCVVMFDMVTCARASGLGMRRARRRSWRSLPAG